MVLRSIALILAAATATPSPSPSPSAAPQKLNLKTIATVKSTPYCGNLGEHFNRIVQPMLANDIVLDRTGVTLDYVTDNLRSPDFAIKFAKSRAAHYERGPKELRQWVEAITTQAPDVLIYPEIGMDPTTIRLASLGLRRCRRRAGDTLKRAACRRSIAICPAKPLNPSTPSSITPSAWSHCRISAAT